MKLDISKTGISYDDIQIYKEKLYEFNKELKLKNGPGSEYAGWVDYPLTFDKSEFELIIETANEIMKKSDVLLVLGIGGSYLGSRAILEGIKGSFYYETNDKYPKIFYAGNNISSEYIKRLTEIIRDKEICVNVISKSGRTTETAISFRIIKELLEKKYSKEELKTRIIVTTGNENSILRKIAEKEGYRIFNIPGDIGGRYSVLTAVGLFPLACAGIDIKQIMAGALEGYYEYLENDFRNNITLQYAVIRHLLYIKDKKIEILVNHEPSMASFAEWWKQLFGESEGKEGKGLYPSSLIFSTDLHSLGQYVQEGERIIFETVINIINAKEEIVIPGDEKNYDEINYLCTKNLEYVNKKMMEAVITAHEDVKVPICIISINEANDYNFGKMIYFFMKSCGISGYLNKINPFNQPGVEAYKKNMSKLLGKPD